MRATASWSAAVLLPLLNFNGRPVLDFPILIAKRPVLKQCDFWSVHLLDMPLPSSLFRKRPDGERMTMRPEDQRTSP